jgi:RimJ/RimL family protein N-acetyltransferase
MWTYLPYGPFPDATNHAAWIEEQSRGVDPLFFAVIDQATSRAVGWVSWLRIAPEHGTIEMGHLVFSPALQRRAAATEALYLMMREAFRLGYRRLEWKCDSLNAPSRAAAERLGFQFEGIFRQAIVVRQRNRDTAWYSVLDGEWPHLDLAFQRWLNPDNFDAEGRQRTRLSDLTRGIGNAPV